jgi:predicted nucleotidyltransferase
MIETGDIIARLRTALPGLREQWPIALSSFLALEDRLAAITGLRIDLVSSAALKPYIGERVPAEAIDL